MSTQESGTFLLPDVGEGLTEAELVTWHVRVGDEIKINDIVCEIETAKSVVELPSPYAGVVQELLVAEGETVEVGTPIIRVGDESDASSNGAPPIEPPSAASGVETSAQVDPPAPVDVPVDVPVDAAADPAEVEQPLTLVGSGPKEAAVSRRPRVLAKPPARALARELGVDLADVVPARADGVITSADLTAAPASPAVPGARAVPAPGAHRATGEREHREPIKGVRKQMGQAMVRSAFTAPHVTEWVTVDVTRTMELLVRLKERPELRDVRVGPMLVLARACILATRRTPIINSVWDEEAQEVVFKHYVNLGIAAATPRGLVVPNIKDADALSLPELAAALDHLVATARDGKTPPPDLSGGTFTITNVGSFGVDSGTPIINPGESAILCFGAIKRKPWIVSDQVVARDVCTLSLSFDHRHIDGAAGSQYLADVAAILEDPATALLF
ncbi:dihydrolipoamide acetyltransferase family protein [Nocardioides sp. BP30]|uniref:dihydrolipoamide acetyltransferase family protein n=1 Tax=Nocardioides sp. BP30 TaxID=3036374 RepID=UPI002468D5E8|nr:dihydrolipoamide acetyltransferase family protein [Nocardioides sp. BP30]WGL52336.1 dihydrolipoamide acetyltransferase family protein [Nocardioides sp. BP30]